MIILPRTYATVPGFLNILEGDAKCKLIINLFWIVMKGGFLG